MRIANPKKLRKLKMDRDMQFEDKDGITPRLNELIKWTRWAVYLLAFISAMGAAFLLRDAIDVVITLFG